jgi:hypothetical protein
VITEAQAPLAWGNDRADDLVHVGKSEGPFLGCGLGAAVNKQIASLKMPG